ncbi:beta-galactoside-binding lectin-like [Osmerus mordax]|uniref:beta-galactoside-binding lectin-like n=1 Tax=Osmerus mordax TaxID=8014 RepID=UPI00350F2A45
MQNVEVRNLSFEVGQILTVTGVPNQNGDRFSINFGHSEQDIALHVDVRFNYGDTQKEVVFNSCHSGNWHKDHLIAKGFPFNYDEKFEVYILFRKEQFVVTLPDESELSFPNRHKCEKYNFIFFANEVKIHRIEVI